MFVAPRECRSVLIVAGYGWMALEASSGDQSGFHETRRCQRDRVLWSGRVGLLVGCYKGWYASWAGEGTAACTLNISLMDVRRWAKRMSP